MSHNCKMPEPRWTFTLTFIFVPFRSFAVICNMFSHMSLQTLTGHVRFVTKITGEWRRVFRTAHSTFLCWMFLLFMRRQCWIAFEFFVANHTKVIHVLKSAQTKSIDEKKLKFDILLLHTPIHNRTSGCPTSNPTEHNCIPGNLLADILLTVISFWSQRKKKDCDWSIGCCLEQIGAERDSIIDGEKQVIRCKYLPVCVFLQRGLPQSPNFCPWNRTTRNDRTCRLHLLPTK